MAITVEGGSIEQAVFVSHQIEEFVNPPEDEAYRKRLAGVDALILIASEGNRPVGFKVGYDRCRDKKVFYSWMGGVLSSHRRQGIATLLQVAMEEWCKKQGYSYLRFKTRNTHKQMILFGLSHGFFLQDMEKRPRVEDHRLIFEKRLT